MLALLVVLCCSLLVSYFLTPLVRDFFGFLVIVDKPDARKVHTRAIPRIGGIPLAISYVLVSVALLFLHSRWKDLLSPHDPTIQLVIRLMPAIILIFVVGLIDDFRGLKPKQKLLGELVAGAYACFIGIRLSAPPGYTGPVFLIYVLSVLWLVFCANAINLIDGIDGLATGVALLASISLLMAAVIHHHPELALAIAPLIGGLFGFLYYNFNPASVFLGDCGSLLVGFLLGCYGLMWNLHSSTGLGMAAPLIAMAFPVAEVVLSIVRRFLRQRPIFSPDRNHIHHRMLSKGLSQKRAVLSLYGVSAIAGLLAVLQTVLQPRLANVILLLFLTVAYLGFRYLGYSELSMLSQFLFAGELRRAFRVKICLKEYEDSLALASSIEQCWNVLREACFEAEFSSVSLRVRDKSFFSENSARPAKSARTLQMWLSPVDSVTFGLDTRLSGLAMLIAPFVERLDAKLQSLTAQIPPAVDAVEITPVVTMRAAAS